jgi:nicotinate-nucleotide pyrophosphorylase (carboxylating)
MTTQTHLTIASDVSRALSEDVGSGDVTAELIAPTQQAHAKLITRDVTVVAGTAFVTETFRQLDDAIHIKWHVADGDVVQPGSCLAQFTGPARGLLTGERTALNFLQTLSGVATKTHQLVQLLAGTRAALFDTRKTLPGLRQAQKYAVQLGGGCNHRIGLFDQVLIKENHIAACGSLIEAIVSARTLHPTLCIQVEVETLDELRDALSADPDIILLDNFDVSQLIEAVGIRDRLKPAVKLEASGGITEANLAAIGRTGVDRISLGTLTKDIVAIDLSMRVELS